MVGRKVIILQAGFAEVFAPTPAMTNPFLPTEEQEQHKKETKTYNKERNLKTENDDIMSSQSGHVTFVKRISIMSGFKWSSC